MGYVFVDDNRDGIMGVGERGIANVEVQLRGRLADGTDYGVAAVMTGADGRYSFGLLSPGTYTITETQPAGFDDGLESLGTPFAGTVANDSITFTIPVSAQPILGTGYNFGEYVRPVVAALSGTVFNDKNRNGQLDAGDTGIAGVTIHIAGVGPANQPVFRSTTTDAQGNYLFADLAAGRYRILENQPDNFLNSANFAGTSGGIVDGDTIRDIVFTAQAAATGYNFGEKECLPCPIAPSSITGRVYHDVNKDGLMDAADTGIAGVLVTLVGTDDQGAVSLTTTTGADGSYVFNNLRPGTYQVHETQPGVLINSKNLAGTAGGTVDGDVIRGIVLPANTNAIGYLFGEKDCDCQTPAKHQIGGFVYEDSDNNGVRAANEKGIAGVEIELTGRSAAGVFGLTTTTDAKGSYQFKDLPGNTTYDLRQIAQPRAFFDGKDTAGTPFGGTADPAIGADRITGIVVPNSFVPVTGTEYNFGEASGALGGVVFQDLNNDGIRNLGEPGIADVTMTLSGVDNLNEIIRVETKTVGDGTYGFTALKPGTYQIAETQPAGYQEGKATPGNQGGTADGANVIKGITLTASQGTGYNFSDTKTAPVLSSISGFVYQDHDNNGSQGAGEDGIAGVTVVLTGTDDQGAVTKTATTAANGAYSFNDLRAGTYQVQETQPTTFFDGKDKKGTIFAADDTASDVIKGIVISAGAGQAGVNFNFGELKPSNLTGRVFTDVNNNGVFDAGDVEIAGVTVTLTGVDDLGKNITATAKTGSPYTFADQKLYGANEPAGLRPGVYKLTQTQPAGVVEGKAIVGTAGGTVEGTNIIKDITLKANTNGTGYDYTDGVAPPVLSSISGFVYKDSSAAAGNNGVKDAGEDGIAGVTIVLTGTDTVGAVNKTTTTGADGAYKFADLRAGTYQVQETQPIAFFDGKDKKGTPFTADDTTSDVIKGIVIPAGAGQAGVNFNFGELEPANLTGRVFTDVNNNGVFDAGDVEIAGVTVTLTGVDDLGKNITATAKTGSPYTFADQKLYGANEPAGLRPGVYKLTQTQPAGVVEGKAIVGTAGGTVEGTNIIKDITLKANVNGTGYDYIDGVAPPLALSLISGFVYKDSSAAGGNNGVKDAGEDGIAGVTIVLTGTDTVGAVNKTTTTGADGAYKFADLRAGTYQVQETQPVAFFDGKDKKGTPFVADDTTSDVIKGIVIPAGAGQAGVNFNFGELEPANLTGRVFTDVNNNGVFDAGDVEIAGVTVTLTGVDDLGKNITATAKTGSPYTFADQKLYGANAPAGLRPGVYRLTETQPAGVPEGKAIVGTAGGTVEGTNIIKDITLKANVIGTGYDYTDGVAPPVLSSLSGFVYKDSSAAGNNNGVKDAGEGGIAGVTIVLTGTDAQGAVNKTTTTGADGSYKFADLRAGTYEVKETQPVAFFDGKDKKGTPFTADDTTSDVIKGIVIPAGAGQAGVNFNFGELEPANLAGRVFTDVNNNGVFDAGDIEIAGVTVTLTGVDDLGKNITATAKTGSPYTFADQKLYGVDQAAGLRPGVYKLTQTQPAGVPEGKAIVGTAGGTVEGTNIIKDINLKANVIGTGYDYIDGVAPPVLSSLSGFVYKDSSAAGNNNGVKDAGEGGIAGVRIVLTGTDTLGAVNKTTTTGADGAYKFANLRPGMYLLQETQPVAYFDGKDKKGTPFAADDTTSDVIRGIVIPAGAGQNGVNFNFGELEPSNLTGRVYTDVNNNSTFDAGDIALAGVTVTLTGVDDLGKNVTVTALSTTTAPYSFAAKRLYGVNQPTGLRPGVYRLTETQPAGVVEGKAIVGTTGGTVEGTNIIKDINLKANAVGTGYDYTDGVVPPQRLNVISGFVYKDTSAAGNNNGVKDAGEDGIGGVRIVLTGNSIVGAVNKTTTTSANGAYSFAGLLPGKYQVQETQPIAYFDGKDKKGAPFFADDTANDVISNIVIPLGLGQVGVNYNFGELEPANLTGRVFTDVNNNGVFDAGDIEIAGVTVTLTGVDDLGKNVTATAKTGSPYTFADQKLYGADQPAGLRPGTYKLTQTQPAGVPEGKAIIGTAGGTAEGTNIIKDIVLKGNVVGSDYHYTDGVAPLAVSSISGVVFKDTSAAGNNNGVRDAGEDGIAGVTIVLTGTDTQGVVNKTATTAADGSYKFADLRAGTYEVKETQPIAFFDGKDKKGTPFTADDTTSDVIKTIVIPAGPGQTGVNFNFGELEPSNLSGRVYIDANNNNVFDLGDIGLSNVTVALNGIDDLGTAVGVPPAQVLATTDFEGVYSFETAKLYGNALPAGLRPGTYRLTEFQPAGMPEGKAFVGTAGGTVEGANIVKDIALKAKVNGTGYDYTELVAPLNAIAGVVFNDKNDNGIKDAGETGIQGAELRVTGPQGAVFVNANADGNWKAENLPAGTYSVTVAQVNVVTFHGITTPGAPFGGKGSLGGIGPSAGITDIVIPAGGAGVNATGYNFGEIPAWVLGGRVFVDANNNDLFDDGETPLAGVSIALTGTDDQNNAVNKAVTTNAAGNYRFVDLPFGKYRITETQPAGVGEGKAIVGTMGGTAEGTNSVKDIVLDNSDGRYREGYNFTETKAVVLNSISGVVFNDKNDNGIKDAGETGVQTLEIILTGAANKETVSDTDGSWKIDNLPAGTYTVRPVATFNNVTFHGIATAGVPFGGTGSFGGSRDSDGITNIVIPAGGAGVNGTGYNFAEISAWLLSGRTYVDANGNDLFDNGETALAGVTIALTGTDDQNNAVNATVTTNAAGQYRFAGLPFGKYRITETQPAGVGEGKALVGTKGGTVDGTNSVKDIVLDNSDKRSATGYDFTETKAVVLNSISGFVFKDLNDNGVKDAGEAGIQGVNVSVVGVGGGTAATNADGLWKVDNLPAGTYEIRENQAGTMVHGISTPGAPFGGKGSYFGGFGGLGTGITNVTIPAGAAGVNGTNYNFGELEGSGLMGRVFYDANNNNAFDDGEEVLAGVTVTLTGTDAQNNPVNKTVTTTAAGQYRFANLPNGNFRIAETQPAGVAEGKALTGFAGGTVEGTNVVKDIVITAANVGYYDNYHFTETKAAGGTGSALTAAEAQAMVAFHNQARAEVANPNGNPPVLPLPPLTWSNEIAAFAQAWADKLAITGQLEHRPPNGPDAQKYGENLAFNPTLMGGAQAWYDEKQFYVYPNPIDVDFQKVGHYTQMVSRRSTMIGVGKAVITTGPFQGMLVIVANYDPPGNLTGQPPY